MMGMTNSKASLHSLSPDVESELNQLNQQTSNDNIEKFCPKLDVDYLFRSRYHQLKGFIRKRVNNDEDAEDLAQTAYMEAIRKADNYKGLSRPDVWLFGIALNLVLNHRKKESNRHRVWESSLAHEFEQMEMVDGPCHIVEKSHSVQRINDALSQLPEEMTQVFDAIIFDNLSYQDAAQKIGVPTGTVRSRLSRARDRLKLALA